MALQDAVSQKVLIKDTITNKNISSIWDRPEVLSVTPISINKGILILDEQFMIFIGREGKQIIKEYVKVRDINSFSFYGRGDDISLILSYLDGDI